LLRDRSKPREKCPAVDIPQHTVMKISWDGWNFKPKPAAEEKQMKAKAWPPAEAERWTQAAADKLLGAPEAPVGCEEWYWLGPNPKDWANPFSTSAAH
jgi:hypothetical protein